MRENHADAVRSKVRAYTVAQIVFLKQDYRKLFERMHCSEEEVTADILDSRGLALAERQEVPVGKSIETRYRCTHLLSNSKGRCYVLRFNRRIAVVTMFPMGRRTVTKFRKRFILHRGIT